MVPRLAEKFCIPVQQGSDYSKWIMRVHQGNYHDDIHTKKEWPKATQSLQKMQLWQQSSELTPRHRSNQFSIGESTSHSKSFKAYNHKKGVPHKTTGISVALPGLSVANLK